MFRRILIVLAVFLTPLILLGLKIYAEAAQGAHPFADPDQLQSRFVAMLLISVWSAGGVMWRFRQRRR